MCLEIDEQVVVGVLQQHAVLLLVAQHGDGDGVDVVAERAADVLVRVGGLHRVDAGHEAGVLVYGVAVHDDVLHGDGQFLVAA